MKPKEKSPAAKRSDQSTAVLRERAMLVRFSISRWYGTGADDEVRDDIKKRHEAQGDVGTFTKRLMTRDRLSKINAVTNEARRFHKERTLAWGDTGARMLPADLFFEYKKEMTAFEMRFGEAVEEFMQKYQEYVQQERKRLNGLFKERDYPQPEQMRKRFRYNLLIEPLPSAEDFRVDLGEEEVRRIKEDMEKHLHASLEDALHEVWESIEQRVAKVKEQLGNEEVRRATFDDLRELVALLPRFNVTSNPDLAAMGQRVANELLSESVETLKSDKQTQRKVAASADKIMDAMAGFMKR